MMNGLLLLNKALGLSSHRAMQQVKRLFDAKKAGHTGSLDPLATGMLPICLGEATKFAQYLLDADKSYQVEGRLGVQTSSGDAEGDIICQQEVPPFSIDEMQQAVLSFQGPGLQIPPMYSALKHKGQPLYRYALKGVELVREPRPIHINLIELISYEHPYFKIRVQSSKGTYMRTLIEDIAKKLGTCAHVTMLHRDTTSGFNTSQMMTIAQLEQMSQDQRMQYVLPMDVMVQQFPTLNVSAEHLIRLQQGQVVTYDGLQDKQIYRLYQDAFMGLGQYITEKGLTVKRLISVS